MRERLRIEGPKVKIGFTRVVPVEANGPYFMGLRSTKAALIFAACLLLFQCYCPTPGKPEIQVCFSPNGGTQKAIVAAIDNCEKSIRVMAYYFTCEEIRDAVLRARLRGVEVAIVLDKTQERRKDSVWKALSDAGCEVRFDRKHRIMHNKVILIDGKLVITGSYNFTKSAEVRNAENCLFIRDTALAGKYLAEFERVFQ